MPMSRSLNREASIETPNPLGLAGIEFVEYTTPRPQALGQVLEAMGFRPVARHRSREVMRYRQGAMNVIVNAHGLPPGSDETPQIAAVALRVRDAGAAWQRLVDLGAWPVPVEVQPMELHIPGIHGVGSSRIFFVDRWREFSIYDVDFVPIPTVEPKVPAVADADALNVLDRKRLRAGKLPLVITPHPGEAARLLGTTAAAVQADRLGSSRSLADATGAIVLLKGNRTIVAEPGGAAAFNSTGNPGMATAGMGDVLTGVVGAFLARGMTARDAARLGAYVHGAAGDRAAAIRGHEGMIASDVVEALPEALLELGKASGGS